MALQSMDAIIASMSAGKFKRADWNKNALPTTAQAAGLWYDLSTGGGITTTGSTSLTFTVADAFGELISSGEGSASITFTPTGQLVASLGGSGSAEFSITTNNPILGAEAGGTGSAIFTLSASGSILPLDDTSPARTASATFTITGALTPYAIGYMTGSTETGGALTEGSIASAVWSAAAASNSNAGTMGELLNGAGGGSSPGAVADAVWAAAIRTLTGTVNANITSVNGAAIDGAGTELNPWGPA